MKKVFLFLALVVATATYSSVKAESFEANDLAIEQTFQNSSELTSNVGMMNMMTAATATTEFRGGGDKNAVVAFVLAWFLGELGIHRFYMGTATMTGVGYILTCGGCGIVATVDWIVLLIGLINNDISKYVNNPKFFMW